MSATELNCWQVYRGSVYDSLNDELPDYVVSGEFQRDVKKLTALLQLEPWQLAPPGSSLFGEIFTPGQVEIIRDFLITSRFPLKPTRDELYAKMYPELFKKPDQSGKLEQKVISEQKPATVVLGT